ncbi:dipeptidyl-peptidase-4 [Allocatelliglobosispora scoriae]|uniref:Dipeptidyl-peptidase-4 n=1 Tax=Allocatelliglobosispora scoriae TaxID=643052 RepID=A0A841BDF5_9ACTN|nr:prolyl oligopeptidase family serine peptidase [Allocatelliglobosispora scoriae]MBB5867137.1 dipeptidyl-peptidase-4 [Allocatelliglobosispora scoriae]
MSMITLPRQLARTRRFTLGAPGHFSIGPGGGTVLFLRSAAGDDAAASLWALDVATGAERQLADPVQLLGGAAEQLSAAERTRRERARVAGSGIVAYSTDADQRLAAFALSGALWTVEIATGVVTRLDAVGSVMDPRLDPTGRRVAYVSDGAVRVIEADGTGDRVVAAPDGPEVTFGLAEHVAAESMGRDDGFWWAPDGQRLLIARVDNAAVMVWYISDPAEPAQPPRAVRYPAVGSANADVTLWVAGLDGERTEVRWDRTAFEYVPSAGWDDHGPYAGVQSRDQGTVRVLAVDPDDGSTAVLAEQRDDCWVQLVPGLPVRTGSGLLVGHADVGETRHLTVAGEPVTPAGLQLDSVIDVEGDEVFFVASAEPTERHLWVWAAETGARQVSSAPGVYTGARRAGTVVECARTPSWFGAVVTVRRGAAPDRVIGSRAQRPVLEPRVVAFAAGERELRSHLFLPSWHREGKLPVLLDPYAGSAAQRVTAEQAAWSLVSQWFAEQGFAVLVVDGSGTPGRGPRWEREVYGDMFTGVLDDQVTALHDAARRFPDLDLDRVAMRGWSFSGTLAALAVLRRPDVFHAAIAGAGVTDQRLYDTHWRERFLGHPDLHPDRYDSCSLLLEAPKLTRPLLLVHGLTDDNVFPANTLRFSHALLAAGRPHEVLPLSRATHGVADEATAENLLLHQLDFLRRALHLP